MNGDFMVQITTKKMPNFKAHKQVKKLEKFNIEDLIEMKKKGYAFKALFYRKGNRI
jgi:hypothetical protein